MSQQQEYTEQANGTTGSKRAVEVQLEEKTAPALCPRRWMLLAIFCAYSMTNAFQWLQYATVNNVVRRFYGQSSLVVDWLSMVYMAVYVPLIIPANWLLHRFGLLPVALLGSFGNAFGAWLKVLSAEGGRFWLTFAGQTVAAVAQIFILGLPAELAAVWFGPREVSKATALGVFGNQLGNALGFLLPPLFVAYPQPWDQQRVAADLRLMFLVTACFGTLFFLLVLFVFRSRPPTAPSVAQAAIISDDLRRSPLVTLKSLAKQRGFVLLFLTYGLCVGCFYAISTLLNVVVLDYFPGEEVNVGRIGLLIVVTGMFGAVLVGAWLDKSHKYKLTTLVIYVCTFLGIGAFTGSLVLGHLWIVFLVAALLGLFMSSYLPLGFEFAAEITYPASEGMTSGLLNASAQIFGIILTTGGGVLIEHFGVISGLSLLFVALGIGAVLTGLIPEELRRQTAENA